MERKYFDIDERSARIAHDMMSFRDYKEGKKTEEYRYWVDKAYDLADRVAARRPEEAEKAYGMAERYARRLAENINEDSRIGMRCPSVMIAGPANFPVKKKKRQVDAWDRNHKEWSEIQEILTRLEHLLFKGSAIQSDDADAVGKLERKLETLKATQERMKEANKAIRMKDTEAGNRRLAELGFDDDEITNLRTPDFCGRIGFANYLLTNNNANIHRIEGRIKELTAVKETGTVETETEMFRVVENTELMRLQIIFDGKPESEVREILKQNGFRWSPKNAAWQRQLTDNARHSLRRIQKALESVSPSEV